MIRPKQPLCYDPLCPIHTTAQTNAAVGELDQSTRAVLIELSVLLRVVSEALRKLTNA